MADNNTLYIPIQINGGTDDIPDLLDRELYIKFNKRKNTIDGYIYIGTENGYIPLRVEKADKAFLIENSDKFKLDAKGESTLSGFSVENGQLKGNGQQEISSFSALDLNKITLNENCYGTDLPNEGVKGQIFFKI